jgi:hypothetical protein
MQLIGRQRRGTESIVQVEPVPGWRGFGVTRINRQKLFMRGHSIPQYICFTPQRHAQV